MIFKTITDETTLPGQRIVGALQARKIAQEQAIKQTNLDIQCLRNYENACKNGTVSSADFTRIMGKASTQAQEYSKNIKEGTGSAQIYADKQKALQQSIQNTGVASKVAAVGVKALSIAGNMLAGMAIAFVFSKIIEGINYLATASKRAIEKTKELQQEISKISSDYQSERQTLEGLRKEYDALTSKIGENGAEASLSADEYERYRDITSEILGITPKLITGWDEEGRAISNKNGLLQQSIDLLDEEYQKSLRNSTTKSKNEEIAAGIIEQKKNFDNSGDTKTVAGTKYDLKSNLWDYIKKAVAEKKINYTYSTGIVGKNDADAAYAINEFVYGDSLYKSTKMRYGDDSAWLKSLMERITSSQENFEKFANSLSNKDNPIYQWFTDEQIDELIRGADEYFQELARIESEEQQYFQQYKDQLNLNAQAVGDAYSDLDEQTKAGIVQMIDSFDYNNMTKEKFSDMATDLKDFVGKLSTDDILLSYFNNLFKPMGEDESIEDYELRVKTGIDEITSYCESNYPAINLSFGDIEKDVEDLKLKYNTAISKFTGDANDVDLGQFFRDNSINDEYEIDYWNKVTEGAKTASEAVEMYNNVKGDTFNDKNPLPFTGFTEAQSKSIDDFQSKMQTLSTALSALRSGEDVGMTELLEQFPELAGQSENLEDAIITLIYDSLDKLYGVLGEGLPDEARQDLQYLADTASGVTPDLNTAFASIQKSYDAMHEFKDAMDTGGLTESILSNVGSLSSYMNQLVAQFHSGATSADELYQALTEHYETDLRNYGDALITKNLMSEEFYNAVGFIDTELIKSFSHNYGVDINECKTYNQAKLAIESQTLNTLGGMWKQYYNIQADAYTDDLVRLGEKAAHGDQEAQKKIVMLQKQVDAYRKAMEALNNIAYKELEKDFDRITSGLNKNNDESSSSIRQETEEIFDFIAIKIENLEKQISRLEGTATDTGKSLKKRQNSYTDAISKTTSEIELQQQAYQKYMEKARAFGLSEEWAQKVREGSLDISSVTDDALKEQIKSYQEWYKKAMECSDALDELAKKKRELETAKIQLEIDVKSDKLAKLENAYDKIENKISLIELFGGRASSGKYAALNKNLREQIRNLYEQNDLITKQAALVTKGSEAWEGYQKSIKDNESSVRKLMQTIAENAKTMAELTNEKTSDRIAGYDSRDDYYSAKADNAAGYKTKNRYLNKEAANIQKRLDAYKNADTENKKALNSAASDITKFKKNSSNRDLLKEAKKYTKSKKEIPASLLEKAAALKDGGALYTAFVNYNAALAAYETGQQTRKLYEETAKKEKASLALEKFKNIESYYDNKQYRYSEKEEDIETEKSMAEAEGRTESTKYYKRLASNEEKRTASLKEQRKKLTSSLEKSVADGTIKKGSDEWYEMKRAIDDVTDAIDKSNLSLKEYENTIRQIKWDRFDTLQSKISNLISEMDFVIKELSRSPLTSSDTGSFTKEGKAVSALRASKYTAYIEQAKDYKKEIKKLNESIAEDPNDQELIKRREELYSAYQQTISAAQDEKDAIIDLYKDGYDALLSRVGELISEYEELMDAEKSAYDYQQKIADATKNISSLRKQLDAYAGDTSEETRAKIQSLTVELEEAEKDLKDTQYDKMISATKDMLSDLQEDMSDSVQDIIDSLSGNFDKLIKQINNNTGRDVINTITDKMKGIGYTPTDELDGILNTFYGSLSNDLFENDSFKEWTDIISSTKHIIEEIREHLDEIIENAENSGVVEELEHEGTLIPGGTVPGKPNPRYISVAYQDTDKHSTSDYEPLPDNMMIISQAENLRIPDLAWDKMIDLPNVGILTASAPPSSSKDISVTFQGDIVLPDVTNPKEFASALKNVVVNNTSVQNLLKDTTLGALSRNNNSLSTRKY